MSKGEWDKEQFIRDMKEKWDIAVDEYDESEEKGDDALVFEAVSYTHLACGFLSVGCPPDRGEYLGICAEVEIGGAIP